MLPPDVRRRVVVTGLGLATPLGCGVELVWKKILLGKSGAQSLKDKQEFRDIPCKVACLIPRGSGPGELNIEDYVPTEELKKVSKECGAAAQVTREALKDARWMPEDRSKQRDNLATGVSMSLISSNEVGDLLDGNYKKISPYTVQKILLNLPAGFTSMYYKLKGPNECVSTACSSSLHAMGDSAHMILRGACDVMVVGGVDINVCPPIMAVLSRAKALTTKFNDEPLKASRPFDIRRDGFVPGEGAGTVILEELEHAKRRNANIYAEILGYGMSSDAHHITSPPEDGNGAARAMKAALRDANIEPERVGHVNAHATSTPAGDLAEVKAIKQVLGENTDALVYAPKGALGHSLAASGVVEAILTILSVQRGLIPPTLNLEEKSDEFTLNYVTGCAMGWGRRNRLPRVAITSSFGFGGTNASLCIGEYDPYSSH